MVRPRPSGSSPEPCTSRIQISVFTDPFSKPLLRRYIFDAWQQEAAALRHVTKAQVLEWFDEHIAQTSGRRKRLSIHVWGRKAVAKQGGLAAVQSKEVKVVGGGKERVVRTLDGSELRTGLEYFPAPALTA
jgi:hypothetical protein